ncbi:helix-turn-helix transcriptional regulator [Leptolyngbya sp. FACHB-711]|uniref:helix-turn-helix transcriptional regulator n=1 Tax=unclassified Leptolyngbya TaxID=2650499 RepID=UPI001689ED9C|nr:helix-turn-helix transcriptional regulator [Leptolyngbya sp. FACHB-711]MBD1848819.1 helix-turn-helix transcriptional regulator [Cyanobacteria bacterium FACHB-502]MBD2027164.1 helix-turn-helix transcriptional regulator [Leptolyngbya sp. FACHB-711]
MAEDKSKAGESPLKQLREKAGLTQEELARRCRIPLRTYQRWESGESAARPNIPQVKALCRELKIPIEQLPDEFGPSQGSE